MHMIYHAEVMLSPDEYHSKNFRSYTKAQAWVDRVKASVTRKQRVVWTSVRRYCISDARDIPLVKGWTIVWK